MVTPAGEHQGLPVSGNTSDLQRNDVWQFAHLPYSPGSTTLNPDRRVAAARHVRGPVLMYFDGHARVKDARLIVPQDWRDVR